MAPVSQAELEEILPEGIDPPADIPEDVFNAALGTFLDCRRLDMRALAGELGIARATLYRRVAGRDHLLGAVIWYLTRHALQRAVVAGEGRRGHRRVVTVVDAFMRDVHDKPALRRLLESEPEAALRILTSKEGPVQAGIIDALRRVLDQESSRGALELGADVETMAYAIVRLGESFLYADVIADNQPDVGEAVEMIARLLRS